jgi:hypothetical protein
MQNFQIEIEESVWYINLNQECIGQIEFDDVESFFVAYPNGAEYSCKFLTLEEAVVELVFHTHRRWGNKICMC